MRIAEVGEGRGSALHGRDEALLAYDSIRYVAEPGLPDEVQALLRLSPHHVERIVPQQKDTDGSEHTVASGGQIPGLGRAAKGQPIEIDRSRDWLCPERSYSHRNAGLCLVGDEAVFVDQIAGE